MHELFIGKIIVMTPSSDRSQQIAIDVFSADCPLCEDALEATRNAVDRCGCQVTPRAWEDGPQQVRYSEGGAYPVPSIAVDGRLVLLDGSDSAALKRLQRSLRLDDATERGGTVHFTFNESEIEAYEGETVAAALLASGCRWLRCTSRRGEPRGVFCGMGVCFDCLMQIDGRPNVQACVTPVRDGMRVETQRGHGTWE